MLLLDGVSHARVHMLQDLPGAPRLCNSLFLQASLQFCDSQVQCIAK